MANTIEQRVENIMANQTKLGFFRLDLFYSDFSMPPFVARISSNYVRDMSFYGRADNFSDALTQVEDYIAAKVQTKEAS